MGALYAYELAAQVSDETLSLEIALGVHLQHNHYPPLPLDLVPACIAAIDAVNAGDGDRTGIALPNGWTFQDQSVLSANTFVEALHLASFCDPEVIYAE